MLTAIYPIFYTAKDFKAGLTDVFCWIKKPDDTFETAIPMQEITETAFRGIYQCSYYYSMTGIYLKVCNSISHPWKDAAQIEIESPVTHDSIRELLKLIKADYAIVSNTLTYKDSADHATELIKFQLKNKLGVPAETNVMFRTKL